jgi:tRNA-dihydrouridine synthase
MKSPISEKSIILAPMEGITDENYRIAVDKAYPEWSYYNTDFLRIPSQGIYGDEKIIKHFGQKIYRNEKLKSKTGFQILAAENSLITEHIEKIERLGFTHLDLNLGCPSKKVNGHRGGAYLLKDLDALIKIVKVIRENYSHFFSAKIRIGYEDDNNFKDIIKILEDQGVNQITIHGRTRTQLYEGRANWEYIKWAVKNSSIPITGNGDVWTVEDAINIFNETDCHSIMLGRGAMKTPWLPSWFEKYKNKPHQMIEEVMLHERVEHLVYFFHLLEKQYREHGLSNEKILKRFKALSRYCFDDFQDCTVLKSKFLRSPTLSIFNSKLEALK